MRSLGIDVWVHRQATGQSPEQKAPAAQRDAVSPAREARQSLEAAQRRKADPVAAPSAQGRGAAGSERAESRPVAVPKPVENDLPACRVVALRVAQLVLLVDGSQLTLARRLGRDLMATITGQWQERPVQTLFDWQPEQVSGVGVSGRRALQAFVKKQLDDLGSGGLIVACAEVSGLLPMLSELAAQRELQLCATAGLNQLATDVEAKRALWAQIQQLKD